MTLLKKSLRIENGWLTEGEHCPSPNYNSRPENVTPRLLVVHNISLPPAKFGGGYIKDFFLNRLNSKADPYFATIESLQVSAHLLIEREGTLVQFVSFDQRAWHAGASEYRSVADCNDFSIGIEMEGTDNIPYTEQQYQQLALVSAALIRYYPQLSPDDVAGHSDIAPQRKTDPGMAFNWVYYNRLLSREITE
ncbi:1,6-anhydro-N-acetylmuramyl-L-alanine amidase AmpD [Amphritea japonica]|uniref:1,6-anhydro-N-acetylmuramyl-L-alanine amidase AmpD n=1 Tax=Amphritea japonica ATCC BAA-1530 TaxID=1278309 RepID=A0A7R6PFJ2_9GAMM|nr:1,6-anhydro-N-acetylmuramyl-L-alanine amidase AmpD [Amphritea japonica]BBB25527.1 N-acetyl-anhydromuranmyl-L-alanine amidase [Amphritea japonica ATCC BAA-1530]